MLISNTLSKEDSMRHSNPCLAVIVLGIVLMTSACGGQELTGTPTASPMLSTPGPQSVCLEGGGFANSGILPVNSDQGGDAASIAGMRWARHEGCERLVIDLVRSDGTAAERAGLLRAKEDCHGG